jgi:hypothetical protein
LFAHCKNCLLQGHDALTVTFIENLDHDHHIPESQSFKDELTASFNKKGKEFKIELERQVKEVHEDFRIDLESQVKEVTDRKSPEDGQARE